MKFLNALQEDDGNNFSYLVLMKVVNRGRGGHSETSNDQALLSPFDHYIKMKAYMRVEEGGGTLYPWVDCPHPPYHRQILTMFIGTRFEKLFPLHSDPGYSVPHITELRGTL